MRDTNNNNTKPCPSLPLDRRIPYLVRLSEEILCARIPGPGLGRPNRPGRLWVEIRIVSSQPFGTRGGDEIGVGRHEDQAGKPGREQGIVRR